MEEDNDPFGYMEVHMHSYVLEPIRKPWMDLFIMCNQSKSWSFLFIHVTYEIKVQLS